VNYSKAIEPHIWRFFRVGGFDQVRIDRASDITSLKALDQKLWAALACPTRGIEFDERTLDLIDSDHDGRIRAPEMLEAIDWTISILKDKKYLENTGDSLPLGAIDDTSERGEAIRKSAKSILNMLGKTDLDEISLQDSLDVERIYSATPFNGDGIIPASSARDEKIQAALEDIMNCLG